MKEDLVKSLMDSTIEEIIGLQRQIKYKQNVLMLACVYERIDVRHRFSIWEEHIPHRVCDYSFNFELPNHTLNPVPTILKGFNAYCNNFLNEEDDLTYEDLLAYAIDTTLDRDYSQTFNEDQLAAILNEIEESDDLKAVYEFIIAENLGSWKHANY